MFCKKKDRLVYFPYNTTLLVNKLKQSTTKQQLSLTASKVKDISDTVALIEKNPTMECPEYLISAIVGYEKSAITWQTKHGINKTKYKSLTKKSDKSMTHTDPGMTVFEDSPFPAATPDLEINCACHGLGLVEIKCPATLIAKTLNTLKCVMTMLV